jgi:hypothetical protein
LELNIHYLFLVSIVDFLAFFRGDKNKPDVEWQFIREMHQGLCPDLFHQPTEGFLESLAGALIGDHNITRDAFDRKMAGLPGCAASWHAPMHW